MPITPGGLLQGNSPTDVISDLIIKREKICIYIIDYTNLEDISIGTGTFDGRFLFGVLTSDLTAQTGAMQANMVDFRYRDEMALSTSLAFERTTTYGEMLFNLDTGEGTSSVIGFKNKTAGDRREIFGFYNDGADTFTTSPILILNDLLPTETHELMFISFTDGINFYLDGTIVGSLAQPFTAILDGGNLINASISQDGAVGDSIDVAITDTRYYARKGFPP